MPSRTQQGKTGFNLREYNTPKPKNQEGLVIQNPHVRIHLARGAPLVHACEAAERPV